MPRKLPHTKIRCCLCGDVVDRIMSHNPWPLATDPKHRCCADCNNDQVIPARLMDIVKQEKEKKHAQLV